MKTSAFDNIKQCIKSLLYKRSYKPNVFKFSQMLNISKFREIKLHSKKILMMKRFFLKFISF